MDGKYAHLNRILVVSPDLVKQIQFKHHLSFLDLDNITEYVVNIKDMNKKLYSNNKYDLVIVDEKLEDNNSGLQIWSQYRARQLINGKSIPDFVPCSTKHDYIDYKEVSREIDAKGILSVPITRDNLEKLLKNQVA